MDRTITTMIDPEKCIGCGACVDICPHSTISIKDGKAVVTGKRSLECGHCEAVCPTGAVQVTALDNEVLRFTTFTENQDWLDFGKFDTAQLVRLMRSRRSCRNYTDLPVERDVLEDLVKIGITAPSGTNSQQWTFTIVPKRAEVLALGHRVSRFFRFMNCLAEQKILRKGLSLVGKKELETYYNEYYESVKDALEEYDRTGTERLFHGAAAAIIIASKPGASCPGEDALLATQNILLAAHAMGLGTCLIGFAVEVMKRDKKVKRFAGIPDSETVHSVIALGYPDEKYLHLTGRKAFTMRYFENSRKD